MLRAVIGCCSSRSKGGSWEHGPASSEGCLAGASHETMLVSSLPTQVLAKNRNLLRFCRGMLSEAAESSGYLMFIAARGPDAHGDVTRTPSQGGTNIYSQYTSTAKPRRSTEIFVTVRLRAIGITAYYT